MTDSTLTGRDHARRFLLKLVQSPKARRSLKLLVRQGYFQAIPVLAQQLRYPTPLTTADVRAVLDPSGRIDDLTAFLNRLAVNPTLRERLTSVRRGDYEAIVAIARMEGLHFSVEALKERVPASFGERFRPTQQSGA